MLTNQGNFLNRCARAGTTDLMNSYPRLKAYYTRALARRHGSARSISTQIGSEWLSRTFLEAVLADCFVSQRCGGHVACWHETDQSGHSCDVCDWGRPEVGGGRQTDAIDP